MFTFNRLIGNIIIVQNIRSHSSVRQSMTANLWQYFDHLDILNCCISWHRIYFNKIKILKGTKWPIIQSNKQTIVRNLSHYHSFFFFLRSLPSVCLLSLTFQLSFTTYLGQLRWKGSYFCSWGRVNLFHNFVLHFFLSHV